MTLASAFASGVLLGGLLVWLACRRIIAEARRLRTAVTVRRLTAPTAVQFRQWREAITDESAPWTLASMRGRALDLLARLEDVTP